MAEATSVGYDVGAQYNADGTYRAWTRFPGFNGSVIGTYSLQGRQLTEYITKSTSNGKVDSSPAKPMIETVAWTSDGQLQLSKPEAKGLLTITATDTRQALRRRDS